MRRESVILSLNNERNKVSSSRSPPMVDKLQGEEDVELQQGVGEDDDVEIEEDEALLELHEADK